MVKFYESTYDYAYSFPAVTLAYFLRYPNPYSTHVLSSDTISRSIDPVTGRLQTTRIHRKSSRLPPAVLKLLPASVRGNVTGNGGRSESFVLETSTIDVREGWMRTESKNLDWTGILSVVETQEYRRRLLSPASSPADNEHDELIGGGGGGRADPVTATNPSDVLSSGTTGVVTTVMFRSRLGERLRRARKSEAGVMEDDLGEEKKGFLANWSTMGIQRSIEAIASRRTENQLGKSKEGMMVVLERLRRGGLGGVLEGMRMDRENAGLTNT